MISAMQAIALLRDVQRRRIPVIVQYAMAGVLICVAGLVGEAGPDLIAIGSRGESGYIELRVEDTRFEYYEGAAAAPHISPSQRMNFNAALLAHCAAGSVKFLFGTRPASAPVLSGWKEIARYCGRGVRTVQRWERDLQMPVHRPRSLHGPVIALENEVREWLVSRETLAAIEAEAKPAKVASISAAAPTTDKLPGALAS